MTFREDTLSKMRAAFGEPEVAPVRDGDLYRWTLTRPDDLNLYVTLDSPEHTDLAHIMVSDSTKYQDKPLVSTIVYTLDEVDRLISRIQEQWKRPGQTRTNIEDIGG